MALVRGDSSYSWSKVIAATTITGGGGITKIGKNVSKYNSLNTVEKRLADIKISLKTREESKVIEEYNKKYSSSTHTSSSGNTHGGGGGTFYPVIYYMDNKDGSHIGANKGYLAETITKNDGKYDWDRVKWYLNRIKNEPAYKLLISTLNFTGNPLVSINTASVASLEDRMQKDCADLNATEINMIILMLTNNTTDLDKVITLYNKDKDKHVKENLKMNPNYLETSKNTENYVYGTTDEKIFRQMANSNPNGVQRYDCTGPIQVYADPGPGTKKILLTSTDWVDGKYIVIDATTGKKPYYKLLYPTQTKDGRFISGYVDISKNMTKVKTYTPLDTNATSSSSNSSSNGVNSVNSTKIGKMMDEVIENMLTEKYSTLNDEEWIQQIRIFGAPYRFLDNTDRSPINPKLGRIGRGYATNIMLEAPIVSFGPGLSSFMEEVNEEAKKQITEYINARGKGEFISGDVMKAINKLEFKYFDMMPAYHEYIKYVNLLCRSVAIYMGIGDEYVPGSPKTNTGKKLTYKSYNWAYYRTLEQPTNYLNLTQNLFTNLTEAVASVFDKDRQLYKTVDFYVDPSSGASESMGNSTTQSQVVSMFDGASALYNEILFLSGGDRLGAVGDFIKNLFSGTLNLTGDAVGGLMGEGNNIKKILGAAGEVARGAKVIFPDLYNSSEYNKSYNFTIKLVSPYGDPVSVYLNIMVPLMHILAFSLPRNVSVNSFQSPFLLKIFSRGYFSCEMGIVDSVTVERDKNSTNIYGLPTEVTVSISVKDLYTSLSINNSTEMGAALSNTTMIEYLSVLSGLNITHANYEYVIANTLATVLNRLGDIPANIDNWMREKLNELVTKVSGIPAGVAKKLLKFL